MGYESKLYVVNRHEFKHPRTHEHIEWMGQVIAMFDLCKMGEDSFYNGSKLFKTPIDFDLNIYDIKKETGYDEQTKVITGEFVFGTREDDYGDALCYAPLEDVIAEMKRILESDDYEYWRMKPCIALLESFREYNENGNIVVVHWGY